MNTVKRLRWYTLSTAAIVLVFVGPTAIAQEPGVARTGIEEIIVTARKREESLQDYAGALTAVTGDRLATMQVTNMQDLRDLIPNLYIEEDLGGQSTIKIFVRGIGIDNPTFSFDSPVGVYIDGVYQARAFGTLADLHDVERVEFLRGPQGTTYGRNNSAGALRVITKKPSLDTVDASAAIGFGTESQMNVRGFLNIPLVEDRHGLRFSVTSRSNDGFMTEQNSGLKYKQDDMVTGRGSYLFVPNEQWQLAIRGDFLADDGTGSLASSIVPAFDSDNDIYTANLNLTPNGSLDVWGTSVDLRYNGSAFDFTSITAYREVDNRAYDGDADATPLVLLEGLIQELDEYQFTQEAFVTTRSESDSVNIDWTAGIFYFEEGNDAIQSFNVFPAIFGPATNQVIDQDTDAFAAYVEADFEVSERVTLTGGLRHTSESKNVALDSFNNDGSFGFSYSDKVSIDELTWKAGANFAVSDDLFVYLLAGTGFRSGGIGINPAGRSVANIVSDTFEPEDAMSYEGGIKATLAGGAVLLNATYFYVEYDSLQLAVAGAGGITVNTPDANVHGLEAELSAELFDGLTIFVNLGTQNDDIKNSALELKNTPDWQSSLAIAYSRSLRSGSALTFAADISFTDDYFVLTDNTMSIDGYSLVNAQVQWTSANDRWKISVSGRNLTDEYFPIHGFRIVPGLLDNEFPNHPRRWLAEVQFNY